MPTTFNILSWAHIDYLLYIYISLSLSLYRYLSLSLSLSPSLPPSLSLSLSLSLYCILFVQLCTWYMIGMLYNIIVA